MPKCSYNYTSFNGTYEAFILPLDLPNTLARRVIEWVSTASYSANKAASKKPLSTPIGWDNIIGAVAMVICRLAHKSWRADGLFDRTAGGPREPIRFTCKGATPVRHQYLGFTRQAYLKE